MPAGRPTKYKHEFCEIALEVLGQGGSRAALAARLGISKSNLWAWEKEHPEFLNAIERGLTASEALWESPEWHPELHPTRWKMNMTNRFGWNGDKTESVLTGKNGGPIQTESKISLDVAPEVAARIAREFLLAEGLLDESGE